MSDVAMKVDVESLEACKRRLSVEAPLDVVREAWERAYGRVQKQARLPGFRKGHVPRSLVKLHFADDVRREVIEHLIPDVYRQALAEARLEPVDDPDLTDVSLEENAPLTFKAVVEIRPAIELGEYKGLDVQHAPTPVTDENVDTALEQMRQHHAELRSVERPAGPGDVVIVDYTLSPEGLPPNTESGYTFQVGEGTVLPEIDEAVVGMSAGEEREVGVRFSAQHRREDLRDRPGQAAVKVVEVKEKVLPALDDDFARQVGDFDTVDAVRAELRRQLELGRDRDDQRALENKVVDAALARHEFPVPEAMVMREVQHHLEHMRERLRRQGVDPDQVSWDYQKLAAELRPGAAASVRRLLLLEAIAAAEGVSPTDADVEAEIEKLAAATRRPAPAVRRMMERDGDLEGLRARLREQQTLDLLIRHATVHP